MTWKLATAMFIAVFVALAMPAMSQQADQGEVLSYLEQRQSRYGNQQLRCAHANDGMQYCGDGGRKGCNPELRR